MMCFKNALAIPPPPPHEQNKMLSSDFKELAPDVPVNNNID
jgi:hypothetical protein